LKFDLPVVENPVESLPGADFEGSRKRGPRKKAASTEMLAAMSGFRVLL
jgi:hypothetical protein